jgi:O-methyltransferase
VKEFVTQLAGPTNESLIDRYLDLLKRSLLDTIYDDLERTVSGSRRGGHWPVRAHTMIGVKRLDNVEFCVRDVLRRGVAGDLIETGVWRGGATILMRGILQAYGIADRTVWVADSFCGLPLPDAGRYPEDAGDTHHTFDALAVSEEEVRQNFERYGLLDERVHFLKGWFRDTLPAAPIQQLAVLRLDGDMYESTMLALETLYPKLSPGGYCIIDDYGAVDACAKAVEDFRTRHAIGDPLQTVDWAAVYWMKTDYADAQTGT